MVVFFEISRSYQRCTNESAKNQKEIPHHGGPTCKIPTLLFVLFVLFVLLVVLVVLVMGLVMGSCCCLLSVGG